MSATRYSGQLRIRVTYQDPRGGQLRGQYRCTVTHVPTVSLDRRSTPEKTTVYVGENLQHGSGIGIDSPIMIDEVAHAALSFADDEGFPASELAASKEDGSGWHVGRSAKTAWTSAPKNAASLRKIIDLGTSRKGS